MKGMSKKQIIIVVIATLVVAIGLGVLSVANSTKGVRKFVADGFILDVPSEVTVTDVNQTHFFGQGSKYKEKFDTLVSFEDTNGVEVSLDTKQFLHYADGSLGSFSKGVIMDIDDLGEDQFGYYSITKNTILIKNGDSYEMTSRGEAMQLTEYLWKISDTDYMIVSPEVTLRLGYNQEITFPDYAQIKYVDNGIVRIIHQQGTYQTVSAESEIITQGGAELNLVGKNFYIDGEPGISLDSISLDDDSYIEIDSNDDTPQLKIPTFNVINGKDGVSGTNGEDGEKGETGEDGDEGTQGEDGTEGMAGAEGVMGAEGMLGKDGVQGDDGIMGYDGKEGLQGESASNSDSDIVAVDLLSRPTFTLDTQDPATKYNVTSNSIGFDLTMNNPDNSIVQGSAKNVVKIYDRKTMQLVTTDQSAEALGNTLMQNGKLEFSVGNLNPDTEYLVVVEGEYIAEENGTTYVGTLFNKIIKTDAVGIILDKNKVTSDSVSVSTKVTSENVQSYGVEYYIVDESGNETELAYYLNLTGDKEELVFSKDLPEAGENRKVASDFELSSNTTYYARICNVIDTDGKMVKVGDISVELKTLKKMPYHLNDDDSKTAYTELVPSVTENNKANTITVSIPSVTDEDNGVKNYRYELYRVSDYNAALADGTLANLAPAFTKDSQTASDTTFSLPPDDSNQYIARVVAEFNDNENDLELNSLFSDVAKLSGSNGLVVEFINMNPHQYPDQIEGKIKILDPQGVVVPYVNATNPLKLTIVGEYDDVRTITITSVPAPTGDTYIIPIPECDDVRGCHKEATYTLSLTGPFDTDGSDVIESAERATYLAGCRIKTGDTRAISLVSRKINTNDSLFKYAVYLTSPEGTTDVDFYKYEAGIMTTLEFELIHITTDGKEKIMGNRYKVADNYADNLTHDSVFFDACWLDRTSENIAKNLDENGDEDGSLILAKDTLPQHTYEKLNLTPASFGIDDKDAEILSGGTFVIRAVVGNDYRVGPDENNPDPNPIPFVDGEDVIIFTVDPKHSQANNPNKQVTVHPITNDAALAGHKVDDLDDDTVVGLLFKSDYPYNDVVSITYKIYEVEDDSISDADLNNKKIYEVNAPADGLNRTDIKGNLIMTGVQKMGEGTTAENHVTLDVELYFEDEYCKSDIPVLWTKTDATKKLERGKRYFISYEVEANRYILSCKQSTVVNDIYPYCTYDDGKPVPFYRSQIISLDKQVPVIARYPYTSDANSITWQYSFEDPDNAISGWSATKGAITNVSTNITGVALDADKRLKLSGLAEGNYYIVKTNYKLNGSKPEVSLLSEPVLFKAKNEAVPTSIRCQGVMSDDNTPEEYKVVYPADYTGERLEKAFVNEGGYRYRITLRGDDLKRYAAYKIIISGTGTDGQTHSVVYDPVYPTEIGQVNKPNSTTTYENYTYLYVDSSPVKALIDAGVTNVNIGVDGYFTTYETGIKDFSYGNPNGAEITGNYLYALRLQKTDSDASVIAYRTNTNGNWVELNDGTLRGSIVIPGKTGDTVGFTQTGNSGVLVQRYASVPLSVADSAIIQADINVTLDETGMKDSRASSDMYYMPEKLKLTGNNFSISDADGKNVPVGKILPAVKQKKITQGARSATILMTVQGAGATSDSKIYAKVYEYDGSNKLLTMEKTVIPGSDGMTYFQVDTDPSHTTATSYSFDNFKDNFIPLELKNGEIQAELKLRGLTQNQHTYKVVFFAYGQDNKEVELYSLDVSQIGHQYTFKTLSNINIDVNQPTYQFISYGDKYGQVRFGIPGDEGTGITIYWDLLDQNGNEIDPTYTKVKVNPLVSGTTYQYYSNNTDNNNPINLDMDPGTGPLRLNSTYKLRVYAMDNDGAAGDPPLGEKTITFSTPTELAAPQVQMTAVSQKQSDMSKVDIVVSCQTIDVNKAIMGDTYDIVLYEDGIAEPVDRKSVTRTVGASNHSTNVTFVGAIAGHAYTVICEANIDRDNNGVADDTANKQQLSQYQVLASTFSSATLGVNATTLQAVVDFSTMQVFDDVEKINVTIYNKKNGAIICSDEFTITAEDKASGEIHHIMSGWSTKNVEAGTAITIQTQYYDASGSVKGNNAATATVASAGGE